MKQTKGKICIFVQFVDTNSHLTIKPHNFDINYQSNSKSFDRHCFFQINSLLCRRNPRWEWFQTRPLLSVSLTLLYTITLLLISRTTCPVDQFVRSMYWHHRRLKTSLLSISICSCFRTVSCRLSSCANLHHALRVRLLFVHLL